jgi:large repetitive protein
MDVLRRAYLFFLFLLVTVVTAGACGFEPSIKDGGYMCATDRSCPSGYVCAADNKCYRPGAGPAPTATTDGGVTTPPAGPPPLVLMADVSGLEGNDANAPDLVLTAKLVPASDKEVRVDWATVEDAAKNVDDFTAASGTIVFPPGSTTQTIAIKIKGDRFSEPNELFYVALSNPVNGKIDPDIPNARVRATILNDDTPGLVVDDITVVEGDTGTANADVIVTLTGPFPTDVTVNYTTQDDTATGPADFQTTTGALTFAPGEMTKIVSVPIVGDDVHEKEKGFFLNLSNAVGAPLLDGQGRITLKDNDPLPAITIDDASVVEGNGGTATLVFTVKASAPSAETMKVSFATADGTAKTATSDYSTASGTLTFDAGQTTQTISVTVNGDTLDEDDETLTVTLSAPVGAALGTKVIGTGTITDDDEAPLVTIESVAANEGNAATTTFPFTVRLSTASSKAVTVSYATANGTATTADNDYVAATGMLTIPAGQTTGIVDVTVNGDVADEGVQTFDVVISAPANATLGATTVGVGTILNDDSVEPKITIDDVTVSEAAGTATFTLTLEKTVSQQVTVDFATGPAPSGAAATAGVDYTATSGTVTWPAFDTVLTKTVTVNIANDAIYEANEVFAVNLTNAVGGNIFDAQGIGTITNDETPPSISIAPVSEAEGNVSSLNFGFVVTLSGAASTDVTVSYATSAGTATAGADYQTTTGILTFAPGETAKTIDVPVNGDIVDEDNETFTVTLSGPSANATLGTAVATGTIQDDDATPTLTINNVTQAEGNMGTSSFVFTVTLSGPSSKTISVDYASANDTATVGSDFSTAMGTLTFAPDTPLTRTITVTVTADTVNEANETFTVNLSNAANATIADDIGLGTIQNDDTPLPTLSITDDTENEGSNLSFVVTLSGTTVSGTVTVQWALVDVTTSTSDRTATALSGTLSFTSTQRTRTITIAASNDSLDEINETFEIRLSNVSSNAEIFDDVGVGTINDTDQQPTVSFLSFTRTVNEGDQGDTDMNFTVQLSAVSGRVVTVDYATSDSTTVSSGPDRDYQPVSGTLSFQPGETSKVIVVRVRGDTTNESDEVLRMTLSNPQGAVLPGSPSPYRASGTINDDD